MSLFLILLFPPLITPLHHNTWSIRLHPSADPHRVAALFDMEFIRPISSLLPHHYIFRHNGYPRQNPAPARLLTRLLQTHHHVVEATQQQLLHRRKREFRDDYIAFSDPLYSKQWYLKHDYNNITGAWALGVTGHGVVVTILDDGLEYTHDDLLDNYEPAASTDLNDNDSDPAPRLDYSNENKHGTRCAGEVASRGNNQKCGVGAAFHAKIGGIRMLDGDVTDAVEASALGLRPDFIDIYSASWGPDDDGKTVDGPGPLTKKTLTNGILNGRNGLGSIFVWASGNGGNHGDNCNCDGYTNSIITISIGSASENEERPWYSEKCSSTLAVTYSSGESGERQISTTDLRNKCTEHHTGTSASAPLAAGIFALALQAYPLLTWRDLQHLVVRSGRRKRLKAADWVTNGGGFNVSHSYGFGVIDAGLMVHLATLWEGVPDKTVCAEDRNTVNKLVKPGDSASLTFTSGGCDGQVRYLEHVQCEVWTAPGFARGKISLQLRSPYGTESVLLAPRKDDTSIAQFLGWPFMSVHHWGEDPAGTWVLTVQNTDLDHNLVLHSWRLVLHGVEHTPQLRDTPRNITNSGNLTLVREAFLRESRNGGSGSGSSLVQVLVCVVYPVLAWSQFVVL